MPHILTDPEISERMDRFVVACRERGLSVTPQRLSLYRALLSSDAHPSPEMLYEQVRDAMPTLSLATVYKAVDTFKALGLVQEVSPLHDRMRLDANMEPHHHLVCVRCRKVVDIYSEDLDHVRLAPEKRRGYKLFDHAVQFNGLCPACQKLD